MTNEKSFSAAANNLADENNSKSENNSKGAYVPDSPTSINAPQIEDPNSMLTADIKPISGDTPEGEKNRKPTNDANTVKGDIPEIADKLDIYKKFQEINYIEPELYEKFDVKRGLRNADGSGVVAGITNISYVHGYVIKDGVKVPDEGLLRFRGYDLYDLMADTSVNKRFRFEEIAYLITTGQLPTQTQLEEYVAAIDRNRELPDGFINSILMRDTPPDIMNVMQRSIQLLYSYDNRAEERSYEHEAHASFSIISRLPRIMVLSYYSMMASFYHSSFIMHPFIAGQSTAETILSMLRPDRQFTPEEAAMLDVMLSLHAEHGGGNNSTFTVRVMSSADTDPYSVYAAALGSLKGRRHGGANAQVNAMHRDIEEHVENWENEDEVADYLAKIVRKEAFDKTGLIYGMGHAVYTKSDPRAVICKRFAQQLAQGTEHEREFELLKTIERISPEVILRTKGTRKDFCANIDMYSGFVYRMMGIPEELYTPLFACGRMAGWTAHRFEEILSGKRIIRPAYKNVHNHTRTYVPMEERKPW